MDWPSTLPQTLEVGSTITQQPSFIRTPTTAGPPKSRRRFTSVTRFQTGSMLLDQAQWDVFNAFWHNADPNGIAGGALSFSIADPDRPNRRVDVLFVQPPTSRLLTGAGDRADLRRLSISWQLLDRGF